MGKQLLIMKDGDKDQKVANYRPMTFLPLLWKVFTRVIADEIYSHQERSNFLPPEQRGCINENPREQKINYLLTETDKFKYGMDSGDQRLGEVNIRRGIF